MLRTKIKSNYPSAYSKVKFFYEGKAEFDNLVKKFERLYFEVHLGFVAIELSFLIAIILLHGSLIALSIGLILLGFVFAAQVAFFLFMRNYLYYQWFVKLFALSFLVIRKGVLNLRADVAGLNSWYGWRARRILKKKNFSKSEMETYTALLHEWSGSYGELLTAVRSL